jgi:hypothetical protein
MSSIETSSADLTPTLRKQRLALIGLCLVLDALLIVLFSVGLALPGWLLIPLLIAIVVLHEVTAQRHKLDRSVRWVLWLAYVIALLAFTPVLRHASGLLGSGP